MMTRKTTMATRSDSQCCSGYLIERSHRADLDVPSSILHGHNQDVPRQNQSRCSQDISNDSKCSHRPTF